MLQQQFVAPATHNATATVLWRNENVFSLHSADAVPGLFRLQEV
jgi:hypothetical protein